MQHICTHRYSHADNIKHSTKLLICIVNIFIWNNWLRSNNECYNWLYIYCHTCVDILQHFLRLQAISVVLLYFYSPAPLVTFRVSYAIEMTDLLEYMPRIYAQGVNILDQSIYVSKHYATCQELSQRHKKSTSSLICQIDSVKHA